MAQANEAYRRGDAESLQRILAEYRDVSDSIPGEGIGAELVRIIRQIAHAKKRLAAIEQELGELRQSEIALFWQDARPPSVRAATFWPNSPHGLASRSAKAQREHDALSRGVEPRGR